jgi:hypothetical protein
MTIPPTHTQPPLDPETLTLTDSWLGRVDLHRQDDGTYQGSTSFRGHRGMWVWVNTGGLAFHQFWQTFDELEARGKDARP